MSTDVVPDLTADTIRVTREADGALWRVTLDSPKGNIIDAVMTAELTAAFDAAAEESGIKAILLCAEGRNFSFGASVAEHTADRVGEMLCSFHGLFNVISAANVPVIVAVRGRCLGGGLELATFCHRIIAHPGAQFAQPEITLGVFAPVASAILAERIGRGAADDLLLTGRTIDAAEALNMGLIERVEEDPEAAALAYIEEHLLPRSASSLCLATRAARYDFRRRIEPLMTELECLYLKDLMATHDANEGITAFLEKRPPQWTDS
jgi:cyclohexa-1,5-dienecarbonyl-CoA hydratase